MNNNEEQYSPVRIFVLIGIVVVIAIIVGIIKLTDTENKPQNLNCDTNLNPATCPEPDYQDSSDTLRQYPDQ